MSTRQTSPGQNRSETRIPDGDPRPSHESRLPSPGSEPGGAEAERTVATSALFAGTGETQVQISDQAVMALLRPQAAAIVELAERLGVTDTAVRQRLSRLMERGWVQRFALREGRGRPKHLYRLTELGLRESGANLDDLAVALWQELTAIEDAVLRERMLAGVVNRLVLRYASEVQGDTVIERMKSVVELFNRRGIPFALEHDGELGARMVVLGCPYPGLQGDHRYICRMEQSLFRRLIGVPLVEISENWGMDSSDQRGHGSCCSFVPLAREGGAMAGEAAAHPEGRRNEPSPTGAVAANEGTCGGRQCDCHGSSTEQSAASTPLSGR
jgi:predicted ArsR family transcriptional regulator